MSRNPVVILHASKGVEGGVIDDSFEEEERRRHGCASCFPSSFDGGAIFSVDKSKRYQNGGQKLVGRGVGDERSRMREVG